ncbi:hypothetical protein [Anaerosporobacter sp.]
MSRLEFIVLSILCNNEATSKFQSMTVLEIQQTENFEYESNTFYKLLKRFVELGAVGVGAKDGRANTYYITKKGKEMIEEAKRE